MLELVLAKLAALGVGAKVAAATATAASVVAAGAATGVVPVLPEKAADRPSAEQTVTTSEEELENVEEVATTDQESGPAERAEFGQRTAADAQDGGVDGRAVAEERSGRELPEQATTGQTRATEAGAAGDAKGAEGRATGEAAATAGQENREQAPAGSAATGEDKQAEAGAENGAAGRETAEEAPAEDAPDGTPAEERAGERR